MAQQLGAQGQSVTLLAALDTYMDRSLQWLPGRWSLHHLRGVLHGGPRYVADALRQRRQRSGAAIPAPTSHLPTVESVAEREAALRFYARTKHVATPYAGDIVLCR